MTLTKAELGAILIAMENGEIQTPDSEEQAISIIHELYGKKEATKTNGKRLLAIVFPSGEDDEFDGIPANVVVAINQAVSRLLGEHTFWSRGKGSALWMYNAELGIFEPDGDIEVRRIMADRMVEDEKFKSHINNEVVTALVDVSAHGRRTLLGGEPNNLVVKNGTFLLDSGTLKRHSQHYRKTTRIDVEYRENATCPRILQFLNEVLTSPEKVQAMLELIGYCLYQDWPYDIIAILVGSGANGKSVLIEVLRKFFGMENVSNRTLQQLANNRFAPASLYGKLVNMAGEIPSTAIRETAMLKDLTGGNDISAEFKHQNSFTFKNTTKLIFSTNEPPAFYDKTTGLWRRIYVFDFPNTFGINGLPATARDILVADLTTNDEMTGLLNEARKGLLRLRENGALTATKTSEETRIDYLRKSNPLEYLAEFFFEFDMHTHDLIKKQVFEVYCRWCAFEKKRPRGERSFSNALRMVATYVTETQIQLPNGSRPKAWKNLRINVKALEAAGVNMNGLDLVPEGYENNEPQKNDGPEQENQAQKTLTEPDSQDEVKKRTPTVMQKFLLERSSGSDFSISSDAWKKHSETIFQAIEKDLIAESVDDEGKLWKGVYHLTEKGRELIKEWKR